MIPALLYQGFTDYDPLANELPEALDFELGRIVQDAKKYLIQGNIEDLTTVLQVAWKLQEEAFKLSQADLMRRLSDTGGKAEKYFHNEVSRIYTFRQKLKLPMLDSETTWSEVFAVIALGNVGLVISASKHPEPKADDFTEYGDMHQNTSLAQYKQTISEAPKNAREAVGYAITIEAEKEAERKIDSAKRIQLAEARNAAIDYYTELREFICREYQNLYDKKKEKSKTISNRQAALLISKKVPPYLAGKLTTDNKPHRYEEWISKFKKGTLTGIPNSLVFSP